MKKCKCGCGETFQLNPTHPNIQYKKGHKPKPVKIPCGCGCGTMIWSLGKRGQPVKFVNGHGSRMRRDEIVRIFQEHRADPENARDISEKLSKAWENRKRKRVYSKLLQMKCKCGYEWIYAGTSQNGGTVCPKCRNFTNKRHAIEVDSSNFKKCRCGCGTSLPPRIDNRVIDYAKGHGPQGEIPCKCGCGTLIKNPDEFGRYRDVVLGHNANMRGPEFFSKIATKMRSGPTSPERRVMKVVDDYKLPVRYTGMGKHVKDWIGRFNPDFVATTAPLVIDVQGDYFHTLENNMKRDEKKYVELKSRGYFVLYLWEGDLKKMTDDEIASKIKAALEAASDFSTRLALIFG